MTDFSLTPKTFLISEFSLIDHCIWKISSFMASTWIIHSQVIYSALENKQTCFVIHALIPKTIKFRVQISSIRNPWFRLGQRAFGEHGISERNSSIRIRSIVSRSWIMVRYNVRQFVKSGCVRKHFNLCARFRIFKAVSTEQPFHCPKRFRGNNSSFVVQFPSV